jgi:gas vesicle protein
MKRNDLIYLMAGTGVGAVIGLLFAPSGGREMRSTLTNRTQEGLDRITQKVDEGRLYVQNSGVGKRAGETIRSVVDRGKNITSFGRQRFNDSIEAGKARYGESIESTDKEWDASSF